MGEAIGATLGYAVGIAVTVTPAIAVVMMLFSARARVNSLSFVGAYALVTGGVAAVAMLIPGSRATMPHPATAPVGSSSD